MEPKFFTFKLNIKNEKRCPSDQQRFEFERFGILVRHHIRINKNERNFRIELVKWRDE